MLQYLILQLDDKSVSFCHYPQKQDGCKLMSLETLAEVIKWTIRNDITIQILYPDYILNSEYTDLINTSRHIDIVSSRNEDTALCRRAEVIVFDSWSDFRDYIFHKEKTYVIRTTLKSLIEHSRILYDTISKIDRLNVIITDITSLTERDYEQYDSFLGSLANKLNEEIDENKFPQINILTDRIFLEGMSNCNAGQNCLAIVPDGSIFPCIGFYIDSDMSYCLGNIQNGFSIPNSQLYRIDHAPICRQCDAYQCHRCVWLNRKTTEEINTPSHEQCVVAHIERNASKKLLESIRRSGSSINVKSIPEIGYLDPFDLITRR